MKKSHYVKSVKEFHRKAYGEGLGRGPIDEVTGYRLVLPDPDVVRLRIKLMKEELKELKVAMRTDDIIGVADGLADLLYVVFGTALMYDMPIDELFAEVHRSNMTKRMDGNLQIGQKLQGKDENYEPPRIAEILRETEWKYKSRRSN